MKKRGEAPAFLFDVDAWLTSVKIAMMTAEQERGYLRLLLFQWKDPFCRLPDDDTVLSVLSKMGEGWFNGGSILVRSCFVTTIEPGFLINERLRVEWSRWKDWQAKSIEGGKHSALARKRQQSTERKRKQRKRDQKRDSSVTAQNGHAVKAEDKADGTNEQPNVKHDKENKKENSNSLKSTSGRRNSMSSKPDRSLGSPEGIEVFEHWKAVTGHPTAIFGPKRRKAVEGRLKEGYTVEQLKLASEGVKRSVFHQGGNDRNTVYDDLELICRDERHVEQFIAFANGTGNGRSIADQKIERLRASHEEFLRRHGVSEDDKPN